MFRHRAGEMTNPVRRAMRVLVHGLVGAGGGISKVRRDVDAVDTRARHLGGAEQPIDDSGGDAVGRRREERGSRCFSDERFDVVEIGEIERRVGALQMRETRGHRRAGLAVGQNGGDGELRVPGNQAQ
jgi:hypothetical protein